MGTARLWFAVFQDLESLLASNFLPALSGVEVSSADFNIILFSPPLQMDGLGVKNPVTNASHCYASSICSIISLVKFIVGISPFEYCLFS